jgi:hypothetical protein
MKTTIVASAAFAFLSLIAGVAAADTYGFDHGHHHHGGGYGYGGYGYHASTYEEGVLRGFGSLIRSQGEANYFNSLARINNQEALSKYLANREQATETYFRMQQINRAARDAQRPQRMTTEQYASLAKKLAPGRLSESEYDRTLGRLSWPAVFSSETFAEERAALDTAFAARRPEDSGVASAFSGRVREISTLMQAKLQAQLPFMDQREYLAAKKFLTGLSYEAQQPLLAETLASAE